MQANHPVSYTHLGSGAVFSIRFGQRDEHGLKEAVFTSFVLIAAVAAVLNILAFAGTDFIIRFLQVPAGVQGLMREYLVVIFCGIAATFVYNYFASLLRAVGNSVAPLAFLAVSAVLNIALDLWFVLGLSRGVAGAAEATVISQYVSGLGLALYTWVRCPGLRLQRAHCRLRLARMKEIAGFSFLKMCIRDSNKPSVQRRPAHLCHGRPGPAGRHGAGHAYRRLLPAGRRADGGLCIR